MNSSFLLLAILALLPSLCEIIPCLSQLLWDIISLFFVIVCIQVKIGTTVVAWPRLLLLCVHNTTLGTLLVKCIVKLSMRLIFVLFNLFLFNLNFAFLISTSLLILLVKARSNWFGCFFDWYFYSTFVLQHIQLLSMYLALNSLL